MGGEVPTPGQHVIDALIQCRAEISDRISDVSEMTGSEILKVGELVNAIVQDIRDHVSDNQRVLETLSDEQRDDGISAAIRRQSESTSRRTSTMRGRSSCSDGRLRSAEVIEGGV
ncbi:MAG: hypothetical protein AAFV53_33300 [Myxococcota bacterium]